MKLPKPGMEGYKNEALFSNSGHFPLQKNLKRIVVHSEYGIYRQLFCKQKNVYLKRDPTFLFNNTINMF